VTSVGPRYVVRAWNWSKARLGPSWGQAGVRLWLGQAGAGPRLGQTSTMINPNLNAMLCDTPFQLRIHTKDGLVKLTNERVLHGLPLSLKSGIILPSLKGIARLLSFQSRIHIGIGPVCSSLNKGVLPDLSSVRNQELFCPN
jgi:hypothetical protein